MGRQQGRDLPLAPYRVLDLTQSGCMLCGKMLGDMGADVVKVEPPGGDPSRRLGPYYKDIVDPEKSLFWFAYNSNKRGITINLETEKGRGVFKRLVAKADFVIESFSPGHMDRLGLGYEALSRVNPRVIMTAITYFGQTGPKANYAASDLIAWAAGGTLYVAGDPDRAPNWVGFPQASLFGGGEGAVASLTAHWHREATGEGQFVDLSIQDVLATTGQNIIPPWDTARRIVKRAGFASPSQSGVKRKLGFKCRDGYVTMVLMGGGDAFLVKSSRAIVGWMAEEGCAPDWLQNFDWANEYDTSRLTQEVVDRVEKPVADFILNKTTEELWQQSQKRGIALVPVSTVKGLAEHYQLRAREAFERVTHPELKDTITYPGAFVKMSQTPLRIRRRAPLIGEHNREIYGGELGVSDNEMAEWKRTGVI